MWPTRAQALRRRAEARLAIRLADLSIVAGATHASASWHEVGHAETGRGMSRAYSKIPALCSRNLLGHEAGQRKRGHVNLGGPVFGAEAPCPHITFGDGRHRGFA